MYTAHIGKRFVEIYNKRMGTELSARDFFKQIFFKKFFDAKNFLQSPANTPLFQVIAQKKTHDPEARNTGLSQIHAKIENFKTSKALLPDMSFAIGFGSADDSGTTSGQITNMKLPFNETDAYCSWIGAGFGIGIQGGQNMLIDNEEILWAIYEGWDLYRKHVDQNEGIGNKIDTWNGIWMKKRFSEDFNTNFPEANFQPISVSKDGKAEMKRPSWVEVLYALARVLKEDSLTAYVYNFSQMNTTIGFIQIQLPEVKKPFDVFEAN